MGHRCRQEIDQCAPEPQHVIPFLLPPPSRFGLISFFLSLLASSFSFWSCISTCFLLLSLSVTFYPFSKKKKNLPLSSLSCVLLLTPCELITYRIPRASNLLPMGIWQYFKSRSTHSSQYLAPSRSLASCPRSRKALFPCRFAFIPRLRLAPVYGQLLFPY